jgi:enamine deaminase RidA (YjgF/YER057c/UK114 family)
MDQTTQVNIAERQSPKTNFKGAFDEVAYSFEKIVGEVRGDSKLVLAKQAVKQLQISLNQFENLLKERGFTVDSYDSIKCLYQEIEHPLSELRRYFMKERSEILTDKAGVVYVNALKASFRKLMDIAEEIDQGHSSIPKSTL